MNVQKIIAGIRMIADGLEEGFEQVEQWAPPSIVKPAAEAATKRTKKKLEVIAAEVDAKQAVEQIHESPTFDEMVPPAPVAAPETVTPVTQSTEVDMPNLQVKFRQAVHHNRPLVVACLAEFNAKALREVDPAQLHKFSGELDKILDGPAEKVVANG